MSDIIDTNILSDIEYGVLEFAELSEEEKDSIEIFVLLFNEFASEAYLAISDSVDERLFDSTYEKDKQSDSVKRIDLNRHAFDILLGELTDRSHNDFENELNELMGDDPEHSGLYPYFSHDLNDEEDYQETVLYRTISDYNLYSTMIRLVAVKLLPFIRNGLEPDFIEGWVDNNLTVGFKRPYLEINSSVKLIGQ